MGIYFGTDGIRGIALKELDPHLAFKCGNSLARTGKNVLVGKDTRISGDCIKYSFISGYLSGGGNAGDLGVATTPCVAYLTKRLGYDYGVVISASHNPAEYNGIKIFDRNGVKIDDATEEKIESYFTETLYASPLGAGKYFDRSDLISLYTDFVVCGSERLNGLKIGLDTANGSAYSVAKSVFKRLGAKVFTTADNPNGVNINDECGATHIGNLCDFVLKNKLDMGFSFDGDADRVMAVDGHGRVIDGDLMLYALAESYINDENAEIKKVVGTPYTNLGIQEALKRLGIEFISGDVGDKYVASLMKKHGAIIGGEQSGHIILADRHTTGDGVFVAIKLCNVYLKRNGFDKLFDIDRYEQATRNVIVSDKVRVLGSQLLTDKIEYERARLGRTGRVMVRASGTESLIRIFVECQTKGHAEKIAERLAKVASSVE